jgi:hypothetical protein
MHMEKILIYILILIGGGIGGYVPTLFGASAFGGWSILGSTVGGILGIVVYFQAKKAGYL